MLWAPTGNFERKMETQTQKTHYFTLTHGCRIGLPEKAGERWRVRLHTTVGCSHGDERRKHDSKRTSSHAQAYVKLQSLNLTQSWKHHCINMCMCKIQYHISSGQMINEAYLLFYPPSFFLFPSLFVLVFLGWQSSLPFTCLIFRKCVGLKVFHTSEVFFFFKSITAKS